MVQFLYNLLGATPVTYDQLLHFVYAAKHLNFTRAAEALYVTPSSISKSVTKLEAEVGSALFVRTSRGMSLTDTGARLAPMGSEIIAKFEEMQQTITELSNAPNQTLHFSYSGFQIVLLSEATALFQVLHPKVRVSFDGVSNNNIRSVLDAVRGGESDFGITFSFCMPPEHGEFDWIELCRDRLVLLVSTDHPLAGAGAVPFEMLSRIPVLINDNATEIPAGDISAALVEQCGAPLMTPEDRYLLENGNQMLVRLCLGAEAALIPRSVAKNSHAAYYRYVEIEGGPLDCDIVLIWKRNSSNPLIPQFLEALAQVQPPEGGTA